MNSSICRICSERNEDFLDIFSEEGVQRNVKAIIGQHFWFQIEVNDEYSKQICLPCWATIENFHNLYKKIYELHKSLTQDDLEFELNKFDVRPIDLKNEFIIKPESNIIHDVQKEEECEEQCNSNSTTDPVRNVDEDSPDGISDFGADSDEESEDEIKPKKNRCKSKKNQKNDEDDTVDSINTASKQMSDKIKRREQTIAENNQIRQFFEMECDLCREKLEDFRSATSHYRIEHNMNGYLVCCSKKFRKRCLAIAHARKHIDPNAFKCEVCNKSFLMQLTLDIHTKNYHSLRSEEPSYKCDLCPKAYHTKHLLINHKSTHREKSHCCPDCGKCFPTNYVLQGHIGTYHKDEDVQICDICAKTFKTRDNFKQHRKLVHGDLGKVQCSECGLWLKHVQSLKRHMINHKESTEIHECDICGKKSPNKKALRKHIQFQHKMERLHSCSFCGKSFKLAIVLREHLASHTGEVLYTCKFCPKTFNSSANMHGHQKKKHPVEWAESKSKS